MEIRIVITPPPARIANPDEWHALKRHAMTESLLYLENRVVHNTPVDRGKFRGSVFHEIRGHTAQLTGVVGSPLVYGPVLERGRRPGQGFPPVQLIEEWAWRKLHQRGLGYIIARSIARRGTKGRYMFEEAADSSRGQIGRIWSRWLSRMGQ